MGEALRFQRRDRDRPARLAAALQRVAYDQAAWSDVCDALAGLLDATGAILIPQDVEDRTTSIPHSSSLEEVLGRYIDGGWARRDFRAAGFPKAMRTGFVVDQDLIAPEEMRFHPYYAELLAPAGLQWFAGTTFTAGGQVWGIGVHRSPRQGPFVERDVKTLIGVREAVGLAARRSAALGQSRLATLQGCLEASGRATIALTNAGKIIWECGSAGPVLQDVGISSAGRLKAADPFLDQRLGAMVAAATAAGPSRNTLPYGPTVLHGRSGRAYSLDVVPMPHDFAALLCGASALVTIHPVSSGPANGPAEVSDEYGLTRREGELVQLLLQGASLKQCAERMQITVMTARQYLKAVFAKTGTNRQAELVAFLLKTKSN